MISLEYITDELKNEMKMNIADSQQYYTWIDILKPLNLYENTLYLEIPKSEMMFVYEKIWTPALQENLDKITRDYDYNIKVVIIAKDSDSYSKILTLGNNYEEDGQMRLKQVSKFPKPLLDRNYTFENFVQGKSNQYAHAIASAVTQNIINNDPTKVYNPLFIYGESGLGKTHLMQAIAHKILEERDDLYVMYISSERFTNELIASIQPTSKNKNQNLNQEFRDKYRSADILLIDDIQFLSNKEGTQTELFHTFNDLYYADKQIVLSSDRPPLEIKDLEDRLLSRFSWGITVDIGKPDFETRVAILQKKSDELGAYIDSEILTYIAENIDTNIRDLEGALSTAIAYAKGDNRNTISMDDAKKGVNTRSLNKQKHVSIDDIQQIVADKYSVKLSDLKGKSRKKEIVKPRHIAMYLARDILDDSLVTISNAFSRDHTTVMHGIDKVKDEMLIDENFNDEIENIKKSIME
ncbi:MULTISPECIES: chromosomal replication initiator protein DnaA [Anaerococcus]|uniref:chromosomal replication initiator protein DnaA n=1 Tax=Anaerococcus TaxID=165779 RepID=UPI001AE79556|nr:MULTISPECIES: chromosomal replication initiator protein DnaA [Anaerococcus]MBP2070057.1 chromosomal replication initiator protein [Anaerococcus nagyae]MDU3210764.1 chromosomal replication initiator protein DnaA [Anaerococcus sp.]